MRFLALALTFLAALAAAPAASVSVPQAQIDAENARWSALGVKLPPGGIVLPHPYESPYSNRSFVVPYAWYRDYYAQLRQKKEVPVDAAALRQDLPVLRLLIGKAYAGYGPARARGWNWDAMFRDWDAQLERSGNAMLPLRTAFAPWGRLERLQLDNHSGVVALSAFTSGSASAVLAADPQGACSTLRFLGGSTMKLDTHDAGQQPHAVQAWNGSRLTPAWYVSYPKRLGIAQTLRCGTHDVALTMAAQTAPPSQKPLYRSIGDGIAYLRLPTFTDANNEALHAELAKVQNLGKERLVIFDLRGNDGGNAPADILANWFAESAIEQAASLSQIGTASCFTVALSFGLQQQLVGDVKPPISAELQQALSDLTAALGGQSDCSVQPQVKRTDRKLADHRFSLHADTSQTRIVALVDSGCGSDCEYMTYVLSGLPGTVIAGTSTFGVMGFTQPGYFVLPHSKIPFRLALSRTDAYGDGRSVDGYGITVDVLLHTEQSQSQQSIETLARLLSNGSAVP